MDRALKSVPASIDSTPYVWMPLSNLTARIGSLIPLPRVSTKFNPAAQISLNCPHCSQDRSVIMQEQEEAELARERLAMVAGLTRVLTWVIGISTADDNKRILRARFLRTVVVLWLIDPHHFQCASQASMARHYKFDKQSFNASVASFRREFDYTDVRFRSPIAVAHMRKPSRE